MTKFYLTIYHIFRNIYISTYLYSAYLGLAIYPYISTYRSIYLSIYSPLYLSIYLFIKYLENPGNIPSQSSLQISEYQNSELRSDLQSYTQNSEPVSDYVQNSEPVSDYVQNSEPVSDYVQKSEPVSDYVQKSDYVTYGQTSYSNRGSRLQKEYTNSNSIRFDIIIKNLSSSISHKKECESVTIVF